MLRVLKFVVSENTYGTFDFGWLVKQKRKVNVYLITVKIKCRPTKKKIKEKKQYKQNKNTHGIKRGQKYSVFFMGI